MHEVIPYLVTVGVAVCSGFCGLCSKFLWKLASDMNQIKLNMNQVVTEMTYANRRSDKLEEELSDTRDRVRSLEKQWCQ